MSPSGAFFSCIPERGGSDIGLGEKSRIVTGRMSAATNVTQRCGLIEPLRKKPPRGYLLTPYTSLNILFRPADGGGRGGGVPDSFFRAPLPFEPFFFHVELA